MGGVATKEEIAKAKKLAEALAEEIKVKVKEMGIVGELPWSFTVNDPASQINIFTISSRYDNPQETILTTYSDQYGSRYGNEIKNFIKAASKGFVE